MIYLAKVQQSDIEGASRLVPLVYRSEEKKEWLLMPSPSEGGRFLHADIEAEHQSLLEKEGFVLVELDDDGHILSIQDATPWMLTLIQQYLSKNLTPEFLVREAQRAEEWRQSLTLQSQDVARRSLEVETRRDQIQELERGLEDKRLKLEAQMAEVAAKKQALEQDRHGFEHDKQQFLEQRQDWEQKNLHGLRE